MTVGVTCFIARDPAVSAKSEPSVYSAGFRHDSPGLTDARHWAAEHSANGRALVIVELVDGQETGREVHFRDGREV